MSINEIFFELIRVAIGTHDTLSKPPSKGEWAELYAMAKKQSLVGICFAAVQKLQCNDNQEPRTKNPQSEPTQNQEPNSGYGLSVMDSGLKKGDQEPITPNQEPEITQNREPITKNLDEVQYLTWMGMAAKIQQRNEVVNRQCVEVERILAERSFKSTIIKGQSLAPYYGELAHLRQSGDIDVWVPVKIETLVEFVKSMGWKYEAKHAHVSFTFPDGGAPDAVEVELHPTPGELRCPWHNRRLQNWFSVHREVDTEFNLVFLLEHMYHHALFEGIGLRQFMDYYFVLKSRNNDNDDDNDNLLKTLSSLGMKRFAAGVMDIMHNVFEMPKEELLCEADPEIGALLLSEVMAGGNFGHYDERYKEQQSQNLFVHGLGNLKRKWPMLRVAFWEVVCSPFWSLWQITWRKWHGYF